jgi:hypothetical protein
MIRFAYHSIAAFVLNNLAALGGWLLRKCGLRSNEHEKLRDENRPEWLK